MSRLRSLCVFLPLAAFALVPACARPPAPPPEPEQPTVVLVGPSGSMSVEDDCIPPPHELPIVAEPSTAADALDVFISRSANGAWKVQYPNGQRVVLGGSDKLTEAELQTLGKLVLPVNRPVKFTATAEDGTNPFEILSFAFALEVSGGKYTQVGVKPTRTGEYAIRSRGARVGTVLVVTDHEFDDWLLGIHATEPPAGGTLAFEGRKLFLKLQCVNCHGATPDAKGKGPVLEGLYGTKVALKGGGAEIADDQYIIESIRKPKAKVVEGWDAIMPAYDESKVSAEELNALVAFVRGLKKGDLKSKEERFPPPNGPPTGPPKEPAPPPREK